MKTKVSIIVPFYNTESYIGVCLNSLMRQTHSDIEILCINDGSTDTSCLIVEKFKAKDSRIHLMNLERSGPGISRNVGLDLCSGQYVMFCDSDDFYEAGMVSAMIRLMREDEEIDIAMCNCSVKRINDTKRQDQCYLYNERNGIFELTQSLKRAINIVLWNKIYKVSLLRRYDLRFIETSFHEDENFVFKYLSLSSKINFTRNVLYTYLYRDDSLSEKSFANPFHINEYLHCVSNFAEFLDRNSLWDRNHQYFAESVIHACHLAENKIFNKKRKDIFFEKIYFFSKRVDVRIITDKNIKMRFLEIQKGLRRKDLMQIPKKGNDVPIFFSCDDNYINYLSVVLQSILDHASDLYVYHIVILDCGITKDSLRVIEQQIAQYHNFTLNIISAISFLKENHKSFKEKDHFTYAIYGRFLIPEICSHFDKALYVDTDMIFCRDIASLMKIDIQDQYIAAVIDSKIEIDRMTNSWWHTYFKERLCLNTHNYYINSGLILLNLKKWREYSLHDKCISLLGSSKEFIFPDQDVINIICKDKIYYLDQSWNCTCPTHLVLDDELIMKKVKTSIFLEKLIAEYNVAYHGLNSVFHYTSNKKPWNMPHINHADKWWAFCKKTECYEIILFKQIQCFINGPVPERPLVLQGNNIKYYGLLGFYILKIKTTANNKKYYILGIRCGELIQEQYRKKYYIFGLRIFTVKSWDH
ncbi:MAG: Glycosyl transferase family 2 protein [Candidatus Tokpelaia sp. JSC161]|jgi:lipopolysaccharide biosynthesis glycosyltransferase|nr:MAG: Glycosyl transferase family 2 protein [Candidatus Tokpelaia sp. JSC161]